MKHLYFMQSFKSFLESLSPTDLHSFLAAMLKDRSHHIRLVSADWLQERGDPLGDYLRLCKEVGIHPDAQNPDAPSPYHGKGYDLPESIKIRELDKLRNIMHNLCNSQGFFINFPLGIVNDNHTHDMYGIEGERITRFTRRNNQWTSVKDFNKLPEGLVRAFIVILGWRMSNHPSEHSEMQSDYMRAMRSVIQNISAVENRIRFIGDRAPKTFIQRVQSSVQHALETLHGASPADKQNLHHELISLRNRLIMYRTHQELQNWLSKAVDKIKS